MLHRFQRARLKSYVRPYFHSAYPFQHSLHLLSNTMQVHQQWAFSIFHPKGLGLPYVKWNIERSRSQRFFTTLAIILLR
jgi:hypothetical protein